LREIRLKKAKLSRIFFSSNNKKERNISHNNK
jgi:hypothetical protein